jgi:hypothetical protein
MTVRRGVFALAGTASTAVEDAASVDAAAPGDAFSGSDAPNDAAGDGGTKAFSPTDFGALVVLWYEGSPKNLVVSDAGDGTVLRWNDLSTFGLHANVPVTLNACGGPASIPDEAGGARNVVAFLTDCQKLGDESGQSNLDFGSRDFLIEVAVSVDRGGSTPFTPLFKRVQIPNSGHHGQVIVTLDIGHVSVTIRPDDPDASSASSLLSASAPMDDKAMHVVGMRRYRQIGLPQDTLELRVDGVHEQIQVESVNLDLGGANFYFGGDHAAGPNVSPNLDIAEMIVVNPKTTKPITEEQVKSVEGYLKSKYGTP